MTRSRMPSPPNTLLTFYLDGRGEEGTLDQTGDLGLTPEEIAKKIAADPGVVIPGGIGPYIMNFCQVQTEHLNAGRPRRVWIEDNQKAIEKSGIQGDAAYRAWLQGRIDETVHALEESVLTILID